MTTKVYLPLVIRASKTSKMPCKSFSLDAKDCITGSKLRTVSGSVCSKCYASKGFYGMPTVREPRAWNLAVWLQCIEKGEVSDWTDAIVKVIGNDKFFRWFDSGDIQSIEMLDAIVKVAYLMPNTRFWLPTHETGFLMAYINAGNTIPSNLVIRKSANMIGQVDKSPSGLSSSVSSSIGTICQAYTRGGKCVDCRSCWNGSIVNIDYPIH